MAIARDLAVLPATAVRWTKYSLNNWYRQAGPLFDASLGYEFFGFGLPEAAEGLAALKEKRSPQFRAVESRLLAGTQAGRPAGRHAPGGGPLRGPAEHGWRTRLAGPRVRQPQDRVRDISYR